MEFEEFDLLDNNLIDKKKIKSKNGIIPDIEKYTNNFDEKENSLNYIDKIIILKNGEYSSETYYKSNIDITKKKIKKYVIKLEPEFLVEDITYEFYGGQPMGTTLFDYKDIKGENVWVVNLKPNLISYLEKKGKIGNFEDIYNQIGGSNLKNIKSFIFNKLKNYFNFNLEENNYIFKNIDDVFLLYDIDNDYFYTYLTIFKDGKFIDKLKINTKNEKLDPRIIMDKIIQLSNSNYYGNIYRVYNSFNKGLILETTNDTRYKIKYN